MTTLDPATLKIEERSLFVPTLEEVKKVLEEGLRSNFAEFNVEIVDCPDLTQEPFTLAGKGLAGNPTVLEIGGPPFLLPTVQKDKLYDIKSILKHLRYENDTFVVGAGAGPWPVKNCNCELIMNSVVSQTQVKNETRIASVNKSDQSHVLEVLKGNETRFALLANFFASEGRKGKVLKVHAKKRTGSNDFIACMQKSLARNYRDKLVGLGGTFLLKQGKAKQHVMPDFSATPLNTEQQLNDWLKFYDMSAPLVAVGTFVSSEADLDLRVQHFHSFSNHGEGGHYHIDTTPETAEYLGYFNLGEKLYRVDRPPAALQFGKD